MDDNQAITEAIAGIADANVISILFPLLRRSLVVDTRHDEETVAWAQVLPQAQSIEERIRSIEKARPGLGKVRALLAIPWTRPLRELHDAGLPRHLIDRLVATGSQPTHARDEIQGALRQLQRYEQLAFARMIRGRGFATVWASREKE